MFQSVSHLRKVRKGIGLKSLSNEEAEYVQQIEVKLYCQKNSLTTILPLKQI